MNKAIAAIEAEYELVKVATHIAQVLRALPPGSKLMVISREEHDGPNYDAFAYEAPSSLKTISYTFTDLGDGNVRIQNARTYDSRYSLSANDLPRYLESMEVHTFMDAAQAVWHKFFKKEQN